MKDLKLSSLLCVCFLVCTLILNPCVTYASNLTASYSNALMTMELNDSDYAVMPMSSLANIKNTVDYRSMRFYVYLVDTESGSLASRFYDIISDDGSYQFYVPEGYQLGRFGFQYLSGCMPSPGVYRFRIDNSSDVSFDDAGRFDLYSYYSQKNVEAVDNHYNVTSSVQLSSGDFYFDTVYQIGTLDSLFFYWALPEFIQSGNLIAGTVKTNFAISNDEPIYSAVNVSDNSSDGYYSDVSSSLSDISSSVESVEEEISLVTQAIQTLQGAMEPHYDNVLTQLHHITEQLHAFYDQVYNNIHLPELDMLTQIRTAIENIDLQIEVDISEVKTAINNMSTAVQNKLQSTTDQVTGGFDNSQQTQQNQQLQDSINAYDEVEEDIFEDVDGFMQEFEYPSFESMNGSVIKALAFIGGFLQSIFLSMGDFGTIITFSLTMIFVMIIVGYHRIRS